jgi:hypothetical protein
MIVRADDAELVEQVEVDVVAAFDPEVGVKLGHGYTIPLGSK